jgi:hypothetical protein
MAVLSSNQISAGARANIDGILQQLNIGGITAQQAKLQIMAQLRSATNVVLDLSDTADQLALNFFNTIDPAEFNIKYSSPLQGNNLTQGQIITSVFGGNQDAADFATGAGGATPGSDGTITTPITPLDDGVDPTGGAGSGTGSAGQDGGTTRIDPLTGTGDSVADSVSGTGGLDDILGIDIGGEAGVFGDFGTREGRGERFRADLLGLGRQPRVTRSVLERRFNPLQALAVLQMAQSGRGLGDDLSLGFGDLLGGSNFARPTASQFDTVLAGLQGLFDGGRAEGVLTPEQEAQALLDDNRRALIEGDARNIIQAIVNSRIAPSLQRFSGTGVQDAITRFLNADPSGEANLFENFIRGNIAGLRGFGQPTF